MEAVDGEVVPADRLGVPCRVFRLSFTGEVSYELHHPAEYSVELWEGLMTLGADLAPPEAMGEFLGIWRLIGDGGALGGPLVVGTIADMLSLGPAIWVIAAIGVSAAAVLGFFVPETLRPPPVVVTMRT